MLEASIEANGGTLKLTWKGRTGYTHHCHLAYSELGGVRYLPTNASEGEILVYKKGIADALIRIEGNERDYDQIARLVGG